MRALYPTDMGPLQRIPATGPAPVLMRFSEWLRVTPEWEDLTARIEADTNAKSKLGWVREMYAFSIACAKAVRLPCPPGAPKPVGALLCSSDVAAKVASTAPPMRRRCSICAVPCIVYSPVNANQREFRGTSVRGEPHKERFHDEYWGP